MGILDLFRKKAESENNLPPAGFGLLPLLFGDSPDVVTEFDEDVSTYREIGVEIIPRRASSVQEIKQIISSEKPEVLHLLAFFTERGSLVDTSGDEVSLRELMTLSEDSGVRLFIIASQNEFNSIRDHIAKTRVMNFMTVTNRNRHFAPFLQGIIAGLSKSPNFALAYVNLAPQHERAQEGLPLPGSIAMCPHKKYGHIVLWSEAQP